MSSKNGYRSTIDQRALVSDGPFVALKQTFDLKDLTATADQTGFEIGRDQLWSDRAMRGQIQHKGRELKWDLKLSESPFIALLPDQLKLIKTQLEISTLPVQLTGEITLDGTIIRLENAPGALLHAYRSSGMGRFSEWARISSADLGKDSSLSAFIGRPKLPFLDLPVPIKPELCSLVIRYQGEVHQFSTFWTLLRNRSELTPQKAVFESENDTFRFKATVQAETREFAVLSAEGYDGNVAYLRRTPFARCEVEVFRNGKLETVLKSGSSTFFEFQSETRAPHEQPLY